MSRTNWIWAIVVILLAAAAYAYTFALLLNVWDPALSKASGDRTVSVFFGTADVTMSREVVLLVLAAAAGALGSLVHVTRSIVAFVGKSNFDSSWVAWYLTRPVVGTAIALLAYVAVRAGFLNVSGNPEEINVYGVATIAGLAGLFSEKVSDKLKQLVETLFTAKA